DSGTLGVRPVTLLWRGGSKNRDHWRSASNGDMHRGAVVGDQRRAVIDSGNEYRQIGLPNEVDTDTAGQTLNRGGLGGAGGGAEEDGGGVLFLADRRYERRISFDRPPLGRPRRAGRNTDEPGAGSAAAGAQHRLETRRRVSGTGHERRRGDALWIN